MHVGCDWYDKTNLLLALQNQNGFLTSNEPSEASLKVNKKYYNGNGL